ncbi:hypothetical protein NQ318_015871 [Aromia moschata]|uniref:Uncharacterized protein n=1 Tax=Aromia moschata TaxID=1265417 RepID=A0AAV8YNK3_9CUCU|nr:hypothetical protein NQ318_015871 [Aromia moschata]
MVLQDIHYTDSTTISRPKDLMEIKSAEIGCILTVMERYWQKPGICKMLPPVRKNLELLQIQGDNSIVLFAWAVLKTSIDLSEEAMDFCNIVTTEMITKKVFKSIHNLLIEKIFALSMEAFPFFFNPFLEMCKSLLSIPEHYEKRKFNLVGTQKLFIDSDLFFIIPEGTVVERFKYQEMEFARFVHPFSFFLLMEQFIKSFNVITFEIGKTWYCYENLTELVQIGFRFIIHILKNYKGDFKSDKVLKELVQRRKFLPQVPNYKKEDNRLFVGQIYNESILFKSLKEEETMGQHSLLIDYLKLIENVVEKNILHKEVQLPGVWVLQRYRIAKHDEDTREIFEMCRNAFMHEEVLISSYLSVFYKDKFYLQELMECESNWISGPIQDYLENIRLQMVLLLLIHKLRTGLPQAMKCTVDDKIGVITKAVSAYMVNPYSTALRTLSFRFLEVLARDENIPLMALLGLDYDQIQRLFLDKLRDPMEDDNVKMHILELISNCIFYQHGMTAAFFNVKRSRRWYSDDKEKTIEGDTVTDFMIDYLQNIKKSYEYLRSPLQLAILRVMTNLWLSGKQHLIKDIVALDAFWPLLADPLFQLAIPNGKDKKFVATIEKFLLPDKQLALWQKYMLEILQKDSYNRVDMEEKELLMTSWLEFILATEREKDLKKFSDEKTKFLFVELCLDGFKYSMANMHCLQTWMSLCLIHITSWGLHFKDKDKIIAKKSIDMYSVIKLHYMELNHITRSSVLTITVKILTNLQTYFEQNTFDLLEFIEHIGPLIEHEYAILEEEVYKELKGNGNICERTGHSLDAIHPLNLKEVWVTAAVLMKFNQAFLMKFQFKALPSCYSFLMLHEQILQHNGTKKIINSCLYTILRPKNIVMYVLDEYYRLNQIEKIPIALMVGIMNRLITAVGLGFSVLYRTNPGLVDLLDVYIPDTPNHPDPERFQRA